eukprot:8900244-Pyramimonas_sp.AAC.1
MVIRMCALSSNRTGLISTLPILQYRVPAGTMVSDLRVRSFLMVLPLQRWLHVCVIGPSKCGFRRNAGRILTLSIYLPRVPATPSMQPWHTLQ